MTVARCAVRKRRKQYAKGNKKQKLKLSVKLHLVRGKKTSAGRPQGTIPRKPTIYW